MQSDSGCLAFFADKFVKSMPVNETTKMINETAVFTVRQAPLAQKDEGNRSLFFADPRAVA